MNTKYKRHLETMQGKNKSFYYGDYLSVFYEILDNLQNKSRTYEPFFGIGRIARIENRNSLSDLDLIDKDIDKGGIYAAHPFFW